MKRLVAFVLLLGPALAFGEETPLSFSEFNIARTRFEKKVWADSTVRNGGATAVTAFSAVMVCSEGGREVARSRPLEMDVLGAGQEAKLTFELVKCPFFTSYVVETTYFFGGKEAKTRFLGRDLFNPPAAERSGPIPGVAYVEVYDLRADRVGKDVKVTLKGKNAGEVRVDLARVRFKFYDADQNLVKEVVCDFKEAFDYGRELDLSATLSGVPDFAFSRADIVDSSTQERQLPEGEFTGLEEVEAAGFRFETRADGSMKVTGRVRNGKKVGVSNVVVKIALSSGGKDVKEVLATPQKPLKPGEMGSFSSVLKNPPEFDDYRYETAYEESEDVAVADPDPVPVDPEPAPVDPDPTPVTPDPAPKPKPEEPKIRSKAQLVELSGAEWIAGDWVGQGKQAKWRGSYLLLTFQFTDKDGKTDRVQQDGMLDFTFKAPAKKDIAGRQKLEKFAWSTDARKFTVANSKAGNAGYDPDARTVKIVILEVPDRDTWNYTLDLKFTSGEGDVWEWKGLSEPYSSAAMKPTGKKK